MKKNFNQNRHKHKTIKTIKVTGCKEKLSNRIGVRLEEEIVEQLEMREAIDEKFPMPGISRGIKSSDNIITLMYMFIDGAVHL